MDIKDLKQHVDKRLDELHADVKTYGKALVKHETELTYLKGFSRYAITILLSVLGFLALAYFKKNGV